MISPGLASVSLLERLLHFSIDIVRRAQHLMIRQAPPEPEETRN
jgi:hypothetical protein